MELAIQRLKGALYNLADYGVTTLDFQVDAPTPKLFAEEIEGRDGFVDLGATYEGRSMRASFFMRSADALDFALVRNEVFRILQSREAFYVIDSREPGKRWLVRANGFSVEQLVANKGRFSVDFTSPSAYAESIGTTLDPKTFDAELWQIGQGLTEEEATYTKTTSTFSIYNAGDLAIDPRELPLKISFTGASTNLKIRNNTTSEEWQYTGTTNASNTIVLDGIRSTKSGLSIFGSTNRGLITLLPGWNDFVITGASGTFSVAFDFRFYYL